jgi:3-hydroxyisobutyrate dehydrogenase-like beta-hydroxyacid dehydrogenase
MTTKSPAVTVLGLGRMGSGIARTLLDAGHEVTVWNRTAEKADRLAERGARVASSVAEAVSASPTVIVSLTSYRAGREILQTAGVESVIAGRHLLQLSTGSAKQARDLASWASSNEAEFLAGMVMGYPRSLGTAEMAVIFGGSAAAYEASDPAIRAFAPGSRLLGDDPGTASTVSAALWNFYYGAYGAFIENAALAHAAGSGVVDFAALAAGMLSTLRDGMEDSARRIDADDLGGEQATIDGIRLDLEGGSRMFAEHGIEPRFTAAFVEYLRIAGEAGDGEKDPAASFFHVRTAVEIEP